MPDTARHFILGGTDGAATGAASSSGFSYWLNEGAEENSNAAYPYIAVGRDGTLAELADADAVLTPEWSVGAPLDAWPDLSDEANFAIFHLSSCFTCHLMLARFGICDKFRSDLSTLSRTQALSKVEVYCEIKLLGAFFLIPQDAKARKSYLDLAH